MGESKLATIIVQDRFEPSRETGREGHIFEDPKVAKYYSELYEEAKYEGRHRFDPEFEWDPEEEKVVKRKVEFGVLLWAFIMFVALDFDRNNLSQATADDMLTDLNLTTNDYNTGNTVNLVCFLLAELPSQLISKWIGPDRWIPIQMCVFSVIGISQSQLKGKTGFLVTRAMLGIFQGGFIPDVCLWFSYFYTSYELPLRFALFYAANPFTSAVGSLLSYGIFHLSGANGWEGWRWLFFIEGFFTLLIGILSFGLMPASPCQTKTILYRKSWFSERQEKILVNRILRDSPEKGLLNNRTAIDIRGLWIAIKDYDMWPIYLNRLVADLSPGPVSTYLSLTLRHLGFSPFITALLSVPINVTSIITMICIPLLARLLKSNSLAFMLKAIWLLPCMIALRFWSGAQVDIWATYALLFIILAVPATGYQGVSWCSSNANSVKTRTVGTAIHNMGAQLAGIISANIYRKDDAPLYHRGNVVIIVLVALEFVMNFYAYFYFKWRNSQKERKWNEMTPEQQVDYVHTTTDEGNKRLDFRFVL